MPRQAVRRAIACDQLRRRVSSLPDYSQSSASVLSRSLVRLLTGTHFLLTYALKPFVRLSKRIEDIRF
jgi:hypothetical protein